VLGGPAEPPEDKTVGEKGLLEALPVNVEELVSGNGLPEGAPDMGLLDDVGLFPLVTVGLKPIVIDIDDDAVNEGEVEPAPDGPALEVAVADAAVVEFGNETELVSGMAVLVLVLPETGGSLPVSGMLEDSDETKFEVGVTPVSVAVPEVAAGVVPGAELGEKVGIGPRFDVSETVPEISGVVPGEEELELL